MSPAYRTDLIPRWVWVMLVIAGLLMLFAAFSMAAPRWHGMSVDVGQEVKTGNPQDYVQKPAPAPPAVAITPSAPPTKPAPTTPPLGFPQSFKFDNRTWTYSGGPVQLDVETTGEYADDHIIYRQIGEQPPYSAVYLESAPNSGQFYKYVPQ